ncbi:MAG: DUF192 domain-containing protein [Coraliomargarita sp.]
MKFLRLYPLFVLIAMFSGCNETENPIQAERQPPSTYFPIELGDKKLHLQLALHEAERSKGLMYRDSLAPDHGMLFVFDDIAQRGFWMRNTRIPLDLAYFDASGTLLELHKLYPYDEVSVKSRSQEIVIVIEMNRGWFERNQLSLGAKLDMSALVKAIQARGLDPKQYPLSILD